MTEEIRPVAFKGVMVSSTFTDLVQHRKALIKAIDGQDLKPVVMENDSALPAINVLQSSLKMVGKAAAYVGVISHKYGQIPECPTNPAGLSLTELEFNEAQRLGRPVLLFIMGPEHVVRPADVETDPEKKRKLTAFRENAKRISPDSLVHRVYKVFNDLQEFEVAATQSVAELRRYLDTEDDDDVEEPDEDEQPLRDLIPPPPQFYAEPPYIGSHQFVGRASQLETLSDWAAAADPHPVLLFEAIGGAGKSMLTWQWTTRHATTVRPDWAGRFWYSFYEKGAVMADFCQHALAYMTERPIEDFRKKKTVELSEMLLYELRSRPWLLVLDGLERVLVAYHRFDAAQLADEEAGTTDVIARRDPCAAIRPEDDELLRKLASAAPSKLLLTSRLIPRILLNPASQPIPGVRPVRLPGLRPADAEELLRSCGVRGTSEEIQTYLQAHCDCHPLVTGVLAGLINDYLPDRGNFDAWVTDQEGGAALNLAELDLVQKRNHILRAALDALPDESRQLLSTLALLSESVDYRTLSALNPHLPPEPKEIQKPVKPEDGWDWNELPDDERKEARLAYQAASEKRRSYEEALMKRSESSALRMAPSMLLNTVRNLERRGLLQYDSNAKRYDLHPVVRGVAAGGLQQQERTRYGQRLVDFFSRETHNPYEETESLDDVRGGLHVVRTLLQMERFTEAAMAFAGPLENALAFNLEAYTSILFLIRPFFQDGWSTLPRCVEPRPANYLASSAGNALGRVGRYAEALEAHVCGLAGNLQAFELQNVIVALANISIALSRLNRVAAAQRCNVLALDLASASGDLDRLFAARLDRFRDLSTNGRIGEAEEMWSVLDPMGRKWLRSIYRPGTAEYDFARFQFFKGNLDEAQIVAAETVAQNGRNRATIRALRRLRGVWRIEQRQWELAASSLTDAVRMAREVGQVDGEAEALLALANFHLGRLVDPRLEAQQLSENTHHFTFALAELWFAIGREVRTVVLGPEGSTQHDLEQAKNHALAAYKWAWADGEPYVRRYELNKARALLDQLGAEIPNLPPYDPSKDERFPWEDEVAAVIAKLQAEKAAAPLPEEE